MRHQETTRIRRFLQCPTPSGDVLFYIRLFPDLSFGSRLDVSTLRLMKAFDLPQSQRHKPRIGYSFRQMTPEGQRLLPAEQLPYVLVEPGRRQLTGQDAIHSQEPNRRQISDSKMKAMSVRRFRSPVDNSLEFTLYTSGSTADEQASLVCPSAQERIWPRCNMGKHIGCFTVWHSGQTHLKT